MISTSIPNYYKNISQLYKKKFPSHKFCLVNIRMINLSLNELKLIAQYRNISDYENKSKKDLIKALSEPKIGINKKKLEEIRKDFYKLRHKFSKKVADKYRKDFYDIKNQRHLLNQK